MILLFISICIGWKMTMLSSVKTGKSLKTIVLTGYYLGITTHRNYQLLELPLINVGNSNVGNSEVFDRNFHFLIVSCRNYHCFLAAHRHLLVANFSCYGPSDDSCTILRHELYCDTHYIATSPKPHCNQYPNP